MKAFISILMVSLSLGFAQSIPNTLNPKIAPSTISTALSTEEVAETVRLKALNILAKFYTGTGSLDYQQLRASPEYQSYLSLISRLNDIDLTDLKTKERKISFWLNIYNALVIHAVVAYEVKKSVLDTPGFFDKAAYQIGGQRFSLNDIEHGILRGNKPTSVQGVPPFASQDARLKFSLKKRELDPRIHFALNCASKSCPAIAFYHAPDLNTQLENATKNFVADDIKLRGDGIYISKLFDWYAVDFRPSVRVFLQRYTSEEIKSALKKGMSLKFNPYDWSLNVHKP